VTETSKYQHSRNGKDDNLHLSKDIDDRCSTVRKESNYEFLVGTRERATPASCIQENPQHDAPMRSERSGSVKEEVTTFR